MATESEAKQPSPANDDQHRIIGIVTEWILPLWTIYLVLMLAATIFDTVTGNGGGATFSYFLAAVVGLYVLAVGTADDKDINEGQESKLRQLPLLQADGDRREIGGFVYSVAAVLMIVLLLAGGSSAGGAAPSTNTPTATPTTTTDDSYGTPDYADDGEGEDDDDVHVHPGSGSGSDDSSGGDYGDDGYDGDSGGDYGDGDTGPDVDVSGDGVNVDWI